MNLEVGTTMHLSLSVRGALKWPARKLRSVFGVPAAEARDYLLEQLASGAELLPLSKCEGHDRKTGCPGHREAP